MLNDRARRIAIEAMRRGAPLDELEALAPCECCCWEHTSAPHCPAYVYGGCRGQSRPAHLALVESYRRFYCETREWSDDAFFNVMSGGVGGSE